MSQDDRVQFCTALCEQLYNPKSSQERDQAQKILEYQFPTFADETGSGIAGNSNNVSSRPLPAGMENRPTFVINTPTDTASALKLLLETSPNPYVQTFSLARLKQLIISQFSIFDDDTKIQLRSFLLEYAFLHPDLMPFIITQLAGVLAQLTLLGWVDIEPYRNIYKDILQFIQASMNHRIVGTQILAVITQDVNPPAFVKGTGKFRKAASGYRDTQLFDIFKLGFSTLKEIVQRSLPFSDEYQEERLKETTLDLLVRCLSFDFSGTSVDESADDIGSIQVPASWRSVFEDEQFVPLFFEAYGSFRPPNSSKVMDCLVSIAAVRRALFTDQEERSNFVIRLMTGIRNVMVTSQGMDDTDNYNSFCRLLYRFRTSAPLNEMVEKPGYIEWIGLVAEFSFKALQSWKWSPNTTSYILGFWSRIVQSMTYYQSLGEEAVLKLESISSEVIRVYIATVMDSVPVRIEECLDDPLENEDSLVETLGMVGQISRCKYEPSTNALISVFDPTVAQYQELITNVSANMSDPESFKNALETIEMKFAWLVYITASFIGNRTAFLNSDKLDAIDGQLTAKVIQLMEVQQALITTHGGTFLNQKLDMAFLYFFQEFKKSYMSDSSDNTEIYNKLTDLFGINNQGAMLNIIMQKIVSNLQYWGDNVKVVERSLELFLDLCSGHMGARYLRQAETTQLLLPNHMSSDLTFFNNPKQRSNRILFYKVLCRLVFAEDNIGEREFFEFMQPFDIKIEQLGPLQSDADFQQESSRTTLQGIFLDLSGFLASIQNRRYYNLFFDWFHPDYTRILLRAMEAWAPDPICNSLLIFFSEFVYNRAQRLNFEYSSPNGILMFRDISRIICTYGQRSLEYQIQDENQKYEHKYKGVALIFNILARCLAGRYVNFGVFWFYQDKSIDEVFDMVLRLIKAIPLQDLTAFPKLRNAYFNLLDEWSRDQLMAIPAPPSPDIFLYLMETCEQGLEVNESVVRSHACTAIFNLCTFVIKQTEKQQTNPYQRRRSSVATLNTINNTSSSEQHWLLLYLNQYPHILPTLMASIFYLVLFEDHNDQWSLSRPLYTLIYLQRDYAIKYTNAVIEQQLEIRRSFVAKGLSNLMDGIKWTLSTRDREQFTQNLSQFNRELRLNNIVLVPLLSPPPI
ncbi:armadillo-type protein [Cunninghamella echinulata]|nr:armadillo-type protein [Cunninghamella echinulata]